MALVSLVLLEGCDPPTCGPGSTLVDGACVAEVAQVCGEGTELIAGQCLPAGGALSCAAGTEVRDSVCVTLSTTLRANATRWTDVHLDLPVVAGGIANGNLPASYLDGTSLIVAEVVPAGPGAVRIVGGGATREGSIDDAYEIPDALRTSFYLPASGVSEPGVFYLQVLGPYFRLENTVLSNPIYGLTSEGVLVLRQVHFDGVLTVESAQSGTIDAVGGTLDFMLRGDESSPGTGDPFDVDTNGDQIPDAWRLEGTATLGQEVWAF